VEHYSIRIEKDIFGLEQTIYFFSQQKAAPNHEHAGDRAAILQIRTSLLVKLYIVSPSARHFVSLIDTQPYASESRGLLRALLLSSYGSIFLCLI
jgi:hypothetical protein